MPRLRTNGGLLGPLNIASNSSASGIWSIQNQRLGELKYWPEDRAIELSKEQYFKNNALLIHADASNNGNNNIFLDSSLNNWTVTRQGFATQGSFSPFSHSGWSLYTPGRPQVTSTINLQGDFTIELWYYGISWDVQQFILDTRINNNTNQNLVWTTSSVSPISTNILDITSIHTSLLNSWNHLVLTRFDNTIYFYQNGNLLGTGFFAGNIVLGYLNFFSRWDTTYNATGYMSNFRIVDNACLYPGGISFTPPISEFQLSSDYNTAILLNNNRYRDATDTYSVLPNAGFSAIVPISPFNRDTSYSVSSVGGSIQLNGTSDYLTIPDNASIELGSSNFTVECWIYALTSASNPANGAAILNKSNSSGFGPFLINFNSATGLLQALFSTDGSSWTTTVTAAAGNTYNNLRGGWNHIAVTRSGTTVTLYLNGSSVGTGTVTGSLVDNADTYKIGWNNQVSTFWPGYISDARIVIGTVVYSGSFTPPSSPLTSIANTAFLIKGTNASIIDFTSKNNIITVGNTVTSTAQAQFGSTSVFFDGTGDWLNIPHAPYQMVRSYDFTIECWAYPTGGAGANRGILSKGTASTGWSIIASSSNTWGFIHTNTTVTGGVPVDLNRWYHVALVRSGTTLRLWVNGSLAAEATGVSTDFNQVPNLYVGCGRTEDIPFTGYIDEVRITPGVARYSVAFIPSLTAFNNI